jgi:hypothetical protein
MFKWSCLAVATAALLIFGWMLNDLRLEIKQATRTANENLPQLLERSRVTAEMFAEIAEDVKQLKELAGLTAGPRDKTLVAYANSVLALVERQDATVGLKKPVGKGLTSAAPAKEWAVGARKEAVYLTLVSKSKAELLNRLCQTLVLQRTWYIQHGDKEPARLLDWLKANHPESKDL